MSDNFIETYTGRYHYFDDLSQNEYVIEDIAHALSLICRFNGHCSRFYSVAQHSVYVSELVTPDYKMEALLHDAAEAYVADIPRPFKNILSDYKDYEKRVSQYIAETFGIAYPIRHVVSNADSVMLMTEAYELMESKGRIFTCTAEKCDIVIGDWIPEKAEEEFLKRYYELKGIKANERIT